MFRVERRDMDGVRWRTFMASPHRVGVDDLHGPPGPAYNNHTGGGDLHGSSPTPGNKTVFAGFPGQQARVRYNDDVIELFEWAKIPVNEFDPDTDMIWGWKLIEQNVQVIPFERLWPLSFVG